MNRYKRYQVRPKGFINSKYRDQIALCKKRGHERPKYTLQELTHWLFKKSYFWDLYIDWIKSNFDRNLCPSLDRIDESKTYSFDNIRLTTWKDNLSRNQIEVMQGKNINPGLLHGGHKAVIQYDLSGNFLREYISISQAARYNNFNAGNICSACKGNLKHAYGFKWTYK